MERLGDHHGALKALLSRYTLSLKQVADGGEIPGSYWGESEAGLAHRTVYGRSDTPVHSVLHESCHTICMSPERRQLLYRDARSDETEENGVCYLQILLADHLPGVGRDCLMTNMDTWGYSFRLGSTRAWFENDADDARQWLRAYDLITMADTPTFRLRSRP